MEKFRTGLFIGRFQPFHKGHLHALRFAARSCRKLVIGIGSSQESGTSRNPLSAKDRITIIRAGLKGSGIDAKRLSFLEIPDFNDNDAWFGYIIRKLPDIDVVFSRTRLVKSIFEGRGIPTLQPPWYMRRKMQATQIREMIRNGGRWRGRIPSGAVGLVVSKEEKVKGAKEPSRIRKRV